MCVARKPACRKLRSFRDEPVRKQPHLPAQPLRALVFREKLAQFILEDACAAWFQENEREPGVDLRGHALQNFGKV
jgi:hypothetical protein